MSDDLLDVGENTGLRRFQGGAWRRLPTARHHLGGGALAAGDTYARETLTVWVPGGHTLRSHRFGLRESTPNHEGVPQAVPIHVGMELPINRDIGDPWHEFSEDPVPAPLPHSRIEESRQANDGFA